MRFRDVVLQQSEANMKKLIIASTIAAVAMLAVAQPASANGYHHFRHFKHMKKPPAPKGPSAGTHGTGFLPQYVFYATACSAVFLWADALHKTQTQKRELTQKEAWTTVGNCFVPVIGGLVMGSLAQQP
jgi:hypothetical protein